MREGRMWAGGTIETFRRGRGIRWEGLLFLDLMFIPCFVAIDPKLPVHIEAVVVRRHFSPHVMQNSRPSPLAAVLLFFFFSLRLRRILVIPRYTALDGGEKNWMRLAALGSVQLQSQRCGRGVISLCCFDWEELMPVCAGVQTVHTHMALSMRAWWRDVYSFHTHKRHTNTDAHGHASHVAERQVQHQVARCSRRAGICWRRRENAKT